MKSGKNIKAEINTQMKSQNSSSLFFNIYLLAEGLKISASKNTDLKKSLICVSKLRQAETKKEKILLVLTAYNSYQSTLR